MNGRLPALADPNVARDFVYVDDVIEAYLLAAQRQTSDPGAVYNVGSGIQTTLRELVEAAKKVMNIPAEPVWNTMANRSWDANVWVSDNRKIRTGLGWKPRHSLADGIRNMRDWFARGVLPIYGQSG
jgi:nucleoside-diphosphate-sugar epimerase